MRITDLEVDGFGVWTGLKLNHLSENLTVIYGPNEAGKTTLMEFVRTVLYGFSSRRRQRYLPPVHGGSAGGALQVTSSNGRFQLRRNSHGGGDGELTVMGGDGRSQGRQQLDVLLAGIDETIYNNVFAVGLREMQELATLDDTEAAQQLYALTGGLDRISLVEVMNELDASRSRIFAADDRTSQVNKLITTREQLRDEITQLEAEARRWTETVGQHRDLELRARKLEDSQKQMQHDARVMEMAMTVRDRWRHRHDIDQQIELLGELPNLQRATLDQLAEINRRIEQHEKQRGELRTQWHSLRDESQRLAVNRELWQLRPRIEACVEQQHWLASLQKQTAVLKDEVGQLGGDLVRDREQLGLTGQHGQYQMPAINSAALAALRAPARAVSDAKRQLETMKSEMTQGRTRSHQVDGKISDMLRAFEAPDLPSALESAGNRVNQLRRRVQLDERLEQLQRNRDELDERRQEALDQRVLRAWQMFMLGSVFVLGAVFVLTGLLGSMLLGLSPAGSWSLSLLGIVGVAAAVMIKLLLEHTAGEQVKSCHRQLRLLDSQYDKLEQERSEVNSILPRGGGPIVTRLRDAEQELARLEELVPLENQQHTAKHRTESAQRDLTDVAMEYKDARRRWQAALASLGLPDNLAPKQVKALAERCEQTGQVENRLNRCQDEFLKRQDELETVTRRIVALVDETNIRCDSDDPSEQLTRLHSALREQKDLMKHRKGLVRQGRALKGEDTKYRHAIARLDAQRREMLKEFEVSSEEEFHGLAGKIESRNELRRERDEITSEIVGTLAGQCSIEDVAQYLDEADFRVERSLEELWDRQQKSEQQLKQMYEKRGQLQQQRASAAGDRRLATARMEISCIDRQLTRALDRWRVLAVTTMILESIRGLYESQRQPETLQEASQYLSRLTGGNYTRVWTPLTENVLRVDDATGQSLSIEVLSCGTREQVFLSLRLALAAGYARRGIILPLVLDDVLVNFDVGRARSAAEVLSEFGISGHQLLVFTCHEHIMEIFSELQANVLVLPVNAEIARRSGMAIPMARVAEATIVDEVEDVVEEEVEEYLEDEDEYEEEVEEEEIEDEVEDVYDEDEDEAEEEEAEYEEEEAEYEEEELEEEEEEPTAEEEDEWEEYTEDEFEADAA